jgi:serine phosphatase RsbU (regulator of sigma subunit)
VREPDAGPPSSRPGPDVPAPRLARLLPRLEAASLLRSFEPLLAGHALTLRDASGAVLAAVGDAVAGEGATAWRGELHAGNVPVGALHVDPAPVAMGEATASALADVLQRLVSAALARRDLTTETLERYREVSLLYRLGDVLGGTVDVTALPGRMLDEAVRLIPAERAGLELDAAGGEAGSWNHVGPDDGETLREACRSTRAHLDEEARPAIFGPGEPPTASIDGSVGVRLWAPIRARDRTIGGIMLARPVGSRMFTAGEGKLLAALASQGGAYLDNASLHRRSLAQARLAKELDLARDVQARLMPRVMPQRGGWQIAGSWTPAREVAGDFFDAVPCGDAVAVAIGDVADKGMAAALFMALTRSVLRASTAPGRSPAAVVGSANALLCADATDGMFVTLAYALLEPDGVVRYTNAGHNPPLVVRADGRVERLGRTGILVAWDPEARYDEAAVTLADGDALVLYTDGVTEARGPHGEYGEARLEALAARHRGLGATALLQVLTDDLTTFQGDHEPYDDATLLVVSRGPVDADRETGGDARQVD